MIREILAASGEVGTGKTHTLCVSKNIVMKSHCVLSGVLKRIREIKVLFLLLLAANSLYAADYSLSYSESSNVMSSTGSRADVSGISPLSYSGIVVIPTSYKKINETFMVMGINSGAFAGSNLTELKIHSGIMQIKSLGSCSSLRRILLEKGSFRCSYNGNNYFSESAFSGTHPDCVVFVPKGFCRSDHMNPGLYDGESYWKYTYLKPGDLFGGRPIEWFHYHVKFNANGGSGSMPEQTIYTDETTNLTANTFMRSGYKFSGWAKSASGDVAYSDKASVKNLDTGINTTVNLYAVWTENKYSVKFNANGGTGMMSNQSFVYGTAQNLAANGFSRDGYSFVGWATSANGEKVYSDNESVKNLTSTANGTVNLYAVWESILGIENVISRQRYPWSGKVDIDLTVKGAENEDYLVSLVARDLDGGTNLPLRTAWQAGGTVTNNAFLVKPGAHRFTWDAAADITNDCEFANVVVNVSAEHNAIIGAKKVLTLEVADYTGTETLTNVPVLVRLSTSIEGFSYADFVDAKGGDLVFTDESGSVVYSHEIDEWHTEGESLVWVKLPRMANGTKFKMAYGNSKFITQNFQLSSHEVWSDYAGVWHMNEDSGTAYDSTANGLDGIPSKGTNELADISQMVAYENGACGRARVNGAMNGSRLNYMHVPASRKFYFGGHFVVSGWFMANDIAENDDPRLISKKNGMSYAFKNKAGFEINYENALTNLLVRGQGTSNFITNTPSILNSWVNLVVVFSGTNVTVYANGKNVGSGIISEVLDNDDYLTLGGGDDPYSLNGQYDEIRLRGGSLSADRIKADYDMIVNRNFLRYGPVPNGKGAAE